MNRSLRARPAAVVLLVTLASTACAKHESGASTTSPFITISTTPSSKDWGPLADCPSGPQTTDSSATPANEGVDGVVGFGKLSEDHVQACVNYPTHPTVGGPHYPVWATCAFYTSPIPEEVAAHSMEHGAVWITFDPKLDQQQLQRIRSAVESGPMVIASPFIGLKSPIVMSAWSRQLSLDSVNDPRFGKFLDVYVQGAQTPEPGAPCEGGLPQAGGP